MLAVLLAVSSVFGQNCISLKGSQRCQGLDDYSVLPSTEFSDLNSLDTYLGKGMFNNPDFINEFKSSFQCPNFAGKGGRYGMSTFCAFLVSASAKSCPTANNAPPLNLCSSTCQAHMSSLQAVLNDQSVCDANPSPNAQTARQTTLQPSKNPGNIAEFCNTLQSKPEAQAGTCFSAISLESANCGFLSADESKAYCAKNPSDGCCGAAADSTGKLLNPANNTFIIAGIVAGVLVAIGVIFFMFQRYSKSRQRPTTAYEPNNRATIASKTFSFFRKNDDIPAVPEMGDNRGRSSLFTTIRASQIFKNGAPPVPSGPIPQSTPYEEMQDGQEQYEAGGSEYKVQIFEDYEAGLDDEMSCSVGDIIIVKEEYDDGWATGFNISSGEEGIFPMAIAEPLNQSIRPASSRVGRPRSGLSARSQSLLPPTRY